MVSFKTQIIIQSEFRIILLAVTILIEKKVENCIKNKFQVQLNVIP
jgi:hypothetical protein